MKKFILGMLTILTFMPIIESITEIICGFLERFKAVNTRKVLILNKEIEDLQEQLSPQCSSAIGFDIPNIDEEYEDYEEEEEDKKNNRTIEFK